MALKLGGGKKSPQHLKERRGDCLWVAELLPGRLPPRLAHPIGEAFGGFLRPCQRHRATGDFDFVWHYDEYALAPVILQLMAKSTLPSSGEVSFMTPIMAENVTVAAFG